MVAEEKKGAARSDTIVVAEFGGLSAASSDPSAVLRIEVFEQIVLALAHDDEVPARERIVIDLDVSRFVAANRHGLVGEFPPLSDEADVIQ